MSNSRIPTAIPAFNSYINTTDNYLQASDPSDMPAGETNAARMGLDLMESDEWTTRRVHWRDVLYPKYSNPVTSSGTVKKDVKLFMKSFHTFGNPLLNRMAASGKATSDDEAVFNFVAERDGTSTERGKIDDIPFCKLIPKGGGEIKIKVRTTDDSTRASRHPLADGVEIKWVVIAPDFGETNTGNATPEDPAQDATASKATSLPAISSDCPNTLISTKAIFTLPTGEGSKNKNLYCFFRWINLATPAHNGSWSDRFQSGIL